MDPLSIIASTLTLIAAVGTVTKTIKSLRGASDELLAVLCELSDFERLLQQSKNLIKEHGAELPPHQLDALSALLERASKIFSDIDTITRYHVAKSEGSGKIRASKLVWSKQAGRITALQKSLESIRLSLSTFLINMSVSFSIQAGRALEGLSKTTSTMQTGQISFQEQTRESLAMQRALLQQIVSRLAQAQIPDNKSVQPRRILSQDHLMITGSCARCSFLRSRHISNVCLACNKQALGMRYRKQPTFRINLLDKKLLLPGVHFGYDYKYLDDIINTWHEETFPIFIKVLPTVEANLELRVRKFEPSSRFEANVYASVFDDRLGWIERPAVRTIPCAIPYTHYVESGRLEFWARESYRSKLTSVRRRPGRSLLAAVGLQKDSSLRNHKLIKAGFTFAALGWVSTSVLYASNRPIRNSFLDELGNVIPASRDSNNREGPAAQKNHLPIEHALEEVDEEDYYAAPSKFAADDVGGLSSCPTAINCQISLLSYERARELEHDIFVGIEKLMSGAANRVDFETFFVIYSTLTLMMDAYESFAIAFSHHEEQFRRCIHLVECLTSELHRFLRGADMVHFLRQQLASRTAGNMSDFVQKLVPLIMNEDNKSFFTRYSWDNAKDTDFGELNFAFQSLLQGY